MPTYLSSEVIHDVITDMFNDKSFAAPSYFNMSWLALLVKQPHHVDPDRGEIFSPENLRPLSVIGCFNRIIASAMRHKLAKMLDRVIKVIQRGFMKGKQILENVIEIEWELLKCSIRSKKGALVLFDFSAAFPSVSHKYMWAVLKK